MSIIKVGLLQMAAQGNDQTANTIKAEQFCREAAAMGADIALFPEMWNIGYTGFEASKPGAIEQWQAQAVGLDSEYVRHFVALAQELDMAIAVTFMEKWPVAPRNSLALIDRHGQILFTYAKVHTCDFSTEEAACTPGDDFYVAELDTANGPVRVGGMICYDREFPESARILMLKGAELILTPNACGLEQNRLGQFRARAYENMVGVAMTNYAAPDQNGHSVAYDPIAFDGIDGPSRNTLIIEAGEADGVYIAPFDMDKLRHWRQTETWGNAYRKPRCYDILTSHSVNAPFIRNDARR